MVSTCGWTAEFLPGRNLAASGGHQESQHCAEGFFNYPLSWHCGALSKEKINLEKEFLGGGGAQQYRRVMFAGTRRNMDDDTAGANTDAIEIIFSGQVHSGCHPVGGAAAIFRAEMV